MEKFKQGQTVYILKAFSYEIQVAVISEVRTYQTAKGERTTYVTDGPFSYEGHEWYSDKGEAITALVDLLDLDISQTETKLAKMKSRLAVIRQEVYIPNKQQQKEIKRKLDEIKDKA